MGDELNVGMKCIKYMLFVANFMFVMIGFLLISIGSTIKAIYQDFEFFMESHYFSPATLAVAIGVIMFLVALFGCVGAIKESTCLINMFGFLLTCILIMEIAAAIAAYAMRTDLKDNIREKMEVSLQDYSSTSQETDVIREIWDFTQDRLHCCGVDQPQDWQPWFPSTTTAAGTDPSNDEKELFVPHSNHIESNDLWTGPHSCCRRRREELNGTDNVCYSKDTWKSGCLDQLTYIVSECALLLGCGALAVAFIQMLGIVFAHMLARAVRRLKTQNLVEREQYRQKLYEQMAKGEDSKPTPVLYTSQESEA